jgi:hypothetical protein
MLLDFDECEHFDQHRMTGSRAVDAKRKRPSNIEDSRMTGKLEALSGGRLRAMNCSRADQSDGCRCEVGVGVTSVERSDGITRVVEARKTIGVSARGAARVSAKRRNQLRAHRYAKAREVGVVRVG